MSKAVNLELVFFSIFIFSFTLGSFPAQSLHLGSLCCRVIVGVKNPFGIYNKSEMSYNHSSQEWQGYRWALSEDIGRYTYEG